MAHCAGRDRVCPQVSRLTNNESAPGHDVQGERRAVGGRARRAVFRLSVADAKRAVSYVRDRAKEFGVDPERVGMIGFSAGAQIALAAAVSSAEKEGPDFVAPIYVAILDYMRPFAVPPTAVPIFLAAASDDQLGFAPSSTEAYNRWLGQRRSAELHIYASDPPSR